MYGTSRLHDNHRQGAMKESWRLFRYIDAHYIRAYEATSRRAFLFDRVSDGVTIKGMAEEWGNKNE